MSAPVACDFSERVAAFASGEPDDELAAHLAGGCASCKAELDDARAVLKALGAEAPAAGAPDRPDARGELFWADFSRGVAAKLPPAPPASSARWAHAVAPGLLAAAAALVLWARAAIPGPGAAHPVAPVAQAALDQADAIVARAGALEPAWLGPEADAIALAASIDDGDVDLALARLEVDHDDAGGDLRDADADADALIEELSDEEIEAATAAL